MGEFLPYPQGRADATKVSILAALEREDSKPIDAVMAKCKAVAETQQELVQMIRDDMQGRN